ncbi:MAG: molybdopterin-guanine dinucleotide biosynthesis protein B [Candidatus Bathyarchaeia archaeon]
MIVIAVIGSKKSGKTTTIESLIRGLTNQGYRVATAKHVSEQEFTIDSSGKDTWRHTQAGAKTVMIVAPQELAIIKKADTTKLRLQEIVESCQNDIDIVILEGFRNLVGHDPAIPKIVSIKRFEEVEEASKRFKTIIAFTGPANLAAKKLDTPVIDVLESPKKLIEIVKKKLGFGP